MDLKTTTHDLIDQIGAGMSAEFLADLHVTAEAGEFRIALEMLCEQCFEFDRIADAVAFEKLSGIAPVIGLGADFLKWVQSNS